MSEELKQCPFCGWHPMLYIGRVEFTDAEVECECGANVGNYPTESEAIDAWNKRASNPLIEEQDARIEELEQKLRTTSLEALAISDANNELQAEIETAKNDLRSFMTSFVREHFFDNTGWQPLPDLLGMLSQMDNASTIARTYRAQAAAAEARLSEAVNVLKVISDTSHRTRDREHYKFPLVIMEWVDAFIATLGGEKNEE